MRWTNPSRPGFSQSQQFSKNQFNRNTRPTQFKETDISNQKNLIYDLRSELSTLKDQFTRLISKPNQIDSHQSRRETFDFPSGHFQGSSQTTFQPRLSLNDKQRTPTHLENISNTQKRNNQNEFTLGKGHSRNSSFTSTDRNVSQVNITNNNSNDLISENQIHKIGPFKHQFQSQKSQQRSNTSNRYSIHDQSINKQKQKQYFKIKIQQNSFTPNQKSHDKQSFTANFSQTDPRITELERIIKQKQQQNQQNRKKIQNLAQQINQISTSKIKELQSMRQILNKAKQEIKAQLEEQKSKLTNKYENQKIRAQTVTNQLREQKKVLQKQMRDLKEKYQNQLEVQIKKLKNSHSENLKQEQRKHDHQISQLQEKIYKKNQFIKDLLSQREIQKDKETLKNSKKQKVVSIQAGINTQELFKQQKVMEEGERQQEMCGKKLLQEKIEQKQKQVKLLQQKIKLYLNNIDKQSGKIKEYKAQVELSQKFAIESQYIIKEKQKAIHNILNQLKNAQKQIQDQRLTRKALQSLLQQSNEQLIVHKIRQTQNKYYIQE